MQQDSKETDVQRATEYFRREIICGSFAPKTKLPSVVAGAELVGVHRLTIAEAYKRLADEGLVEIKRSVGAFVKSQVRKAEYAFFTGTPQRQHTFMEALCLALSSRLAGEGPPLRSHLVERDEMLLPRFLETVHDMARSGRLSGAFMVNLTPEWVLKAESILSNYAIPMIHFSSRKVAKQSILTDLPKGVRRGTQWLAECGCRNLVNISIHSVDPYTADREAFVATCEALGIAYRELALPFRPGRSSADFELFGKEAGEKLVHLPSLPDGLLITDDVIGRGVLSAIVRLGLDVPDALQVCTLARKGDSYPSVFGLPVARLEVDCAVLAEAACDMMRALCNGEARADSHVRIPINLALPESDMEPSFAEELATSS